MTDTIVVDPAPAAAPQQFPLQDKFDIMRDQLTTELIERPAVIDTQLLAVVSKGHHFQLGEPGVAKSLSLDRFIKHITVDEFWDPASDYFEVLMTRFSNPEEINGPLDLQALQNSRYKYQTEGYAPEAKIWFLDEIWKANSSILNSLLWATQSERKFRNDGAVAQIPLWSMFCASNEMPEGEELNALFDRIHFRLITRRIQEPGNFIKMLKLDLRNDDKILTWSEIEAAQAEAAKVTIPDDVLEALVQVKQDLKAEGIEPTDRRFRECLKVVQADTWWNSRSGVADIENLRPLKDCLWTEPNEQGPVEKLLLELANPLDKEAMDILTAVEKLADELDKTLSDKTMEETLRNKKGVELHGKVRRAREDLTSLQARVTKSGRKSAKVQEVRDRLFGVTKRLLIEVFGLSPDEVEDFD